MAPKQEAPVGYRNNKRKQVMGEPSSAAAVNLSSVQAHQQVQQLPCQFSSAGHQLNMNNQQQAPTETDNLDKFMPGPFTSYTALLTEGLEEQTYVPVNIQHLVEQTTIAHCNEVRNMLYNVYGHHYNNLVNNANQAAARKVRERERQLRQARTIVTQLQQTAHQLNYSRQILQSRVRTLEDRIAMQDAALRARAGGSGSRELVEDAHSSSVDPNRLEPPLNMGTCRACGNAEATAILLPCRHLCVCATCSLSAAVNACPVCQSPKYNSIEVILP